MRKLSEIGHRRLDIEYSISTLNERPVETYSYKYLELIEMFQIVWDAAQEIKFQNDHIPVPKQSFEEFITEQGF